MKQTHLSKKQLIHIKKKEETLERKEKELTFIFGACKALNFEVGNETSLSQTLQSVMMKPLVHPVEDLRDKQLKPIKNKIYDI